MNEPSGTSYSGPCHLCSAGSLSAGDLDVCAQGNILHNPWYQYFYSDSYNGRPTGRECCYNDLTNGAESPTIL